MTTTYGFGQGCGYCEGGYGTVSATTAPTKEPAAFEERPEYFPELQLEIVTETEKEMEMPLPMRSPAAPAPKKENPKA